MNNPTNPIFCKDCKFCPYNVNPEFKPNTTLYFDSWQYCCCPMWDDGDGGYGAEWHGESDGWCYRGEAKE